VLTATDTGRFLAARDNYIKMHNYITILPLIATVLIAIASLSCCRASATDSQQHNSDFSSALILSSNSSDSRRKVAYLVTKSNSRPSIFPSPIINSKTGKSNDLCDLSLKDITELWGSPHSEKSGEYRFEFPGFAGKWATFQIDLKFESDRCYCYRVTGPGISYSQWIGTDELPKLSSRWTSLPPWVGCIDGPFNTSRCGIDIP
jgi:hypothetical protein